MTVSRYTWRARAMLMGALLFALFTSTALPAFAQTSLTGDITAQYEAAGDKAGLSAEKDPQQLIAEAIQIILGLVGTLFLVLIVFAGYVRLTSHGEDDRIKKSTSTAVAALIGLTIVLVSYGITVFVTARLSNSATYEPQYEENNQAPNTIYEKNIDLKLFN